MPSRPTWFWTSFLTSIGVNALLFVSAAEWLYSIQPIYMPGYSRGTSESPVYIANAGPKIADTILGDPNGHGDATDASPGDEPMEARIGPETQAFMSRDPEGPGKIGEPPSPSTAIPGENGNGDDGAPAMFGAATPQSAQATPAFAKTPPPVLHNNAEEMKPPEEIAKTSEDSADVSKKIDIPDLIAQGVSAPERKTKGDAPEANDPPAEAGSPEPKPMLMASIADPKDLPIAPSNPSASSIGGGKPGPNIRPADPAPQTESESDPFSTKNSVKFKRGSTDVQFGRKHKLVRPQIGLAAQTALLNLHEPTIVLALTLDEKGNVVSVTILKSSGSKDLDQALKVAAYQWWIEPTKNAAGKAIKDVIPFVVGFT